MKVMKYIISWPAYSLRKTTFAGTNAIIWGIKLRFRKWIDFEFKIDLQTLTLSKILHCDMSCEKLIYRQCSSWSFLLSYSVKTHNKGPFSLDINVNILRSNAILSRSDAKLSELLLFLLCKLALLSKEPYIG